MKKALISPNEAPIKYISGWTATKPYQAVYSNYADSCRVAEVVSQEFEVAEPFFWVDCADDVVADQFYYDTVDQTIKPIVNEPKPEPVQPESNGTQTL